MAETTNMAPGKDSAGQTRQSHEVLYNILLLPNHSQHCEPQPGIRITKPSRRNYRSTTKNQRVILPLWEEPHGEVYSAPIDVLQIMLLIRPLYG